MVTGRHKQGKVLAAAKGDVALACDNLYIRPQGLDESRERFKEGQEGCTLPTVLLGNGLFHGFGKAALETDTRPCIINRDAGNPLIAQVIDGFPTLIATEIAFCFARLFRIGKPED